MECPFIGENSEDKNMYPLAKTTENSSAFDWFNYDYYPDSNGHKFEL
ncbi:MAG: hypothetical protein AAFY76_14675 [Cyanobacteria bacterium J06649_11]